MNPAPRLIAERPDTCDTCQWAVLDPKRLDLYICHGSPPVPVITGTAGMGQLHIETIRPQLPKGTRACSFHKRKVAVLV